MLIRTKLCMEKNDADNHTIIRIINFLSEHDLTDVVWWLNFAKCLWAQITEYCINHTKQHSWNRHWDWRDPAKIPGTCREPPTVAAVPSRILPRKNFWCASWQESCWEICPCWDLAETKISSWIPATKLCSVQVQTLSWADYKNYIPLFGQWRRKPYPV